jgi:hypothetical protein
MRAPTWLDRVAPAGGAVAAMLTFVGSVTASRATEETDPTRSGAAIAATSATARMRLAQASGSR